MTNKTLPRLLELQPLGLRGAGGAERAARAAWFDHGVDLLAGTVVLDAANALRSVQQGGRRSLFGDSLAMIELEAAHFERRGR